MSVLQDDRVWWGSGCGLGDIHGAVCWCHRDLCVCPERVLPAPDTAHHLPRPRRFLSVTVKPLGV